MKADKPLEWHENKHFPNQWQAATEFDRHMTTYTVHPRQICQDHYNRRRRLKAWEDYMATHEVPETPTIQTPTVTGEMLAIVRCPCGAHFTAAMRLGPGNDWVFNPPADWEIYDDFVRCPAHRGLKTVPTC